MPMLELLLGGRARIDHQDFTAASGRYASESIQQASIVRTESGRLDED